MKTGDTIGQDLAWKQMDMEKKNPEHRGSWGWSGDGMKSLPSPTRRGVGRQFLPWQSLPQTLPHPSAVRAGTGLAWAGTEGSWATDPAPLPNLRGEGRKGGRGVIYHPPPQALIETINQTQKYYARPGARERWLVAMATPEPASPWSVGGGDR